MHYNSIDHFLTVHEPDIATLIEDAERVTGGHYSAMAPEQLHQTAQSDAHELIAGLRAAHVDRTTIQETARETETQGIALDDLTRMSLEIERRFIPYVQAELAEQPEFAADLVRRCRHITAGYRSNITTVKLDRALGRLKHP
jgi:hypothetical protein